MRIVFCDDDREILSQLQSCIEEYFSVAKCSIPSMAAYTDGDELLENEGNVDIAFLDIEMPGTSGIQVGARLKEINPRAKIFIVTSYPDYLDEAMKFQVFRYLSKPIDKNRLFRNLKEALEQYNAETKEIPVVMADGVTVLTTDRLVCVEANRRRCRLYTLDGVIDSPDNMEHWQTLLKLPAFYRTHRSFIVNMKYVSGITRDTVLLKYKGDTKEAYLARRKYQDFKDSFMLYMESSR